MEESKYFVVRPIINGFEAILLMYGQETDIKKYIEFVLATNCTYSAINKDFARNLFDIGFKVYMCPEIGKVKTDIEENN